MAFLVFAALVILIGVNKGKKYRWQYSFAKIILTIVAAVAAMGISALIGWLVGKSVSGLLASYLVASMPELDGISSLSGAIAALVASVLAPILFYAIFPIVRSLAGRLSFDLAGLLMKLNGDAADMEIERRLNAAERGVDDDEYLIEKLKKEMKPRERRRMRQKELRLSDASALGAIFGALLSFLLFCIYLVPITGMATVANDVLPAIAISPIGDLGETASNVAEGASDNIGAVTVRAIGGKALYAGMTTYSVDGSFSSLLDESQFLSEFVEGFVNYSGETIEGETPEDVQKRRTKAIGLLRDSTESFNRSNIVPLLFSELLPEVAKAWENNEDAMIPKPDFAGELEPIISCIQNTSASTVKADYATLARVYALAIEHDVTSGLGTGTVKTFSNEEFSHATVSELLANPRFVPAVANIVNAEFKDVFDKIGAKSTLDGAYDALISELCDVYNESVYESNQAYYLTAYNTLIFDQASLRVTSYTIETLVAQQIQQFGILFPTEDEFKDFFANTALDFIMADGSVLHEKLSSQSKLEELSLTVRYDDVKVESKSIKDSAAEAERLALAFSKISEFVNMLNDSTDTASIEKALDAIGEFAKHLEESEIVGKDVTAKFLTAILQSEKLQNKVGLTSVQAVSLSQSIVQSGHYADTMKAISKLISIMSAASQGQATDQTVKEMFGYMSAETAAQLQIFANESVLWEHGVGSNASGKVNAMLGKLFANMALAQEGGLTESELATESAAISDIFEVAMNARSANTDNLAFGANSITGLSAGSFVDRVFSSSVVSQTLVDIAYGGTATATVNPLRLASTLTEEEQSELLGALNNAWNYGDQGSEPPLAKKIVSVAALVNCAVTVNSGEVEIIAPEAEE